MSSSNRDYSSAEESDDPLDVVSSHKSHLDHHQEPSHIPSVLKRSRSSSGEGTFLGNGLPTLPSTSTATVSAAAPSLQRVLSNGGSVGIAASTGQYVEPPAQMPYKSEGRKGTRLPIAAHHASSASPLSSPRASDEDERDVAASYQGDDDEDTVDEAKHTARGPNKNVNYKVKFQKARERYSRIQADSAILLKGLQDAQRKERKLEEEINWLLDTLASRRPDLAHLES